MGAKIETAIVGSRQCQKLNHDDTTDTTEILRCVRRVVVVSFFGSSSFAKFSSAARLSRF